MSVKPPRTHLAAYLLRSTTLCSHCLPQEVIRRVDPMAFSIPKSCAGLLFFGCDVTYSPHLIPAAPPGDECSSFAHAVPHKHDGLISSCKIKLDTGPCGKQPRWWYNILLITWIGDCDSNLLDFILALPNRDERGAAIFGGAVQRPSPLRPRRASPARESTRDVDYLTSSRDAR